MFGAAALAFATLITTGAAIMPQSESITTKTFSIPHLWPTPVPMATVTVNKRIIPTPVADSTTARILGAGAVPGGPGPRDATTFETHVLPVDTTSLKRGGCYVTTINAPQDKITSTICPAPAACTPWY
ncbi:hypothetical protein LTR85_000609 [Meristemomyces frigidus]|nr:hypothetical protein LTR85_000609 [Meristemomyces frigidus]